MATRAPSLSVDRIATAIILAGLAQTLAVYVIAGVVGLAPGEAASFLGDFVTQGIAPSLWGGRGLFAVMAVVWGLIYLRARNLLPGPPWQRGALYGFLIWAFSGLILLPLLAWAQPAALGIDPGLFGAGFGGWRAVVTSLLAHLVYGVVLGVYIRPEPTEAWRDAA